ncbi:MAG: PhzF family phenazine biosynthesis protein [Flavobacteriaceae bacterium]
MKIPLYQVDAFTNRLFCGNPAAVCVLEHWLEDAALLQIAQENNLAETAFIVPLSNERFHLRWFTPELEMDLCGHATLAAAYVLFQKRGFLGTPLIFETQSGPLSVKKAADRLVLDFPSRPPEKVPLPEVLKEGLNLLPKEVWKARDYLLVYANETQIRELSPNKAVLNQLDLGTGGIIVTAPGEAGEVDFVSRFFTPGATIFEDPVTGSAHCSLVPYWAQRLHQNRFKAHQLSPRGGELWCSLQGDRVELQGQAVLYLQGWIEI